MQESAPLRPSEFVKIREGFIAFLRQPTGTPLQAIIPADVVDAMASAAKRGRRLRLWLDLVRLVSTSAAVVAIVLILASNPIKTGIGIPLLMGAGTAFILAHFRTKVRDELEIEDIVAEPNEALQRNLRALAEFRNLIASGDIPCAEMLPDGTLKPLVPKALRAFVADHGALFVLSRDQALWQCAPHRPIPMSELRVKLAGRVSCALVTSRTLLDTIDRDLFDRRVEWLLSHANEPRARSFREAIQIIVALRRPELDGLTFEGKKEILRAEGISDSRLEKIHAGVYPAFNGFLRSLPMHEFP